MVPLGLLFIARALVTYGTLFLPSNCKFYRFLNTIIDHQPIRYSLPSVMLCARGAIIGSALGGALLSQALLALLLLSLLRHQERKERRRAEEGLKRTVPPQAADPGKLTKTVVIENRGPIGGTPGLAEIVTTGPNGTQVSSIPTAASGVAIVSTVPAGLPGTVSVEPGKKAIVTAEHPIGLPEQAVVTGIARL